MREKVRNGKSSSSKKYVGYKVRMGIKYVRYKDRTGKSLHGKSSSRKKYVRLAYGINFVSDKFGTKLIGPPEWLLLSPKWTHQSPKMARTVVSGQSIHKNLVRLVWPGCFRPKAESQAKPT